MAKRRRVTDEQMPKDEALEGILYESVEISEGGKAEFIEGDSEVLLELIGPGDDNFAHLTLSETYNLFEWLRTHEVELLSLVSE